MLGCVCSIYTICVYSLINKKIKIKWHLLENDMNLREFVIKLGMETSFFYFEFNEFIV